MAETGLGLTREQIQAVINQKIENTVYWLKKAYELRPEDSLTEKTLLELMAKLTQLRVEANTSLASGFVRSAGNESSMREGHR